jgi:hypothetical protein
MWIFVFKSRLVLFGLILVVEWKNRIWALQGATFMLNIMVGDGERLCKSLSKSYISKMKTMEIIILHLS